MATQQARRASSSWWIGLPRDAFLTMAQREWESRMRFDQKFGILREREVEADLKKVWAWPIRTGTPRSPDCLIRDSEDAA